MIQPTLINLQHNEYSQEFHYYPFSIECKCKFDGTKYKSNQLWNNNDCRCECKKIHVCEKD